MAWLEKLLGWLKVERHDIGRKDIPVYLTRWVLFGRRDPKTGMRRYGDGRKVFLHLFHRGDAEPYFHDHPWPFWSLILWGGYWEWTPLQPGDRVRVKDRVIGDPFKPETLMVGRWHGPLSLLRRPAVWRHRVDLGDDGRRCWTLLWIGAKVRSWGFWCQATGFLPWRQHEANQAAGGAGCP